MTARWSASALAILALHAPHGTAAQAATALPDFTACVPAAAPVLPERWRAVGLLFPFLRQQLEVGEFVYDGSLPVLRATIYGLEYGAVDLLITDNGTYQLSGPSEAPTACTTLGRKYTPPTRQWIGGGAVCDGEAAIATKRVQWWKTPSSDGRTNWQWYSADTQLPWRI